MEYTDYCPNCDQRVLIEEETHNYTIKNTNGKPIHKCPKCEMKLEVVGGVLSVVEDE